MLVRVVARCLCYCHTAHSKGLELGDAHCGHFWQTFCKRHEVDNPIAVIHNSPKKTSSNHIGLKPCAARRQPAVLVVYPHAQGCARFKQKIEEGLAHCWHGGERACPCCGHADGIDIGAGNGAGYDGEAYAASLRPPEQNLHIRFTHGISLPLEYGAGYLQITITAWKQGPSPTTRSAVRLLKDDQNAPHGLDS